ncbi:phage tail protein [Alicycliphilus denitrificans]|jgi:hypothetical protein|uniref:Tail fiber protein n=1 Tax=Alicycliphilus denitrificans TaxID=179636 RepID=A0A420KBN2_9BURK|nr:phage tail protein [Alicycliphilus denitrificans]RKJ96627.1 tail fiber protein [Alicycliphilus denitrificans]
MPVPDSIDYLSTDPANNYPLGSESVFPNLDNYLRAHAAFIAQLRDRINSDGLPLMAVMWWGGVRASIPARMLALDGQVLNRTAYPALWALVSGGGYPVVAEADWLGDPLRRASFSAGNGATTFRMPDLNGKQPNGIGAATVRGDGAFAAAGPGRMQDAQNLSHTHGASSDQAGHHTHYFSGSTGASGGHTHGIRRGDYGGTGAYSVRQAESNVAGVEQTEPAGAHAHDFIGTTDGSGAHAHAIAVNSAGGDEARMKSATGTWVMRVL